MRSRTEFVVLAVLALTMTASLLTGCSKQDPAGVGGNLAPETTLSFVSDPGDTVASRVHLKWSGSDRDGEVVAYLARWDTLDWFGVTVTDSVFVLASGDSSDVDGSYNAHTFSVKAIDDDGEEDPTPAILSFTSRNTFPETEIVHGPLTVTSPMVCIEWRGWDYDGVVVGYGFRLYADDSGEWIEVAGSDDLPPDEFEIMFGPIAGLHRFEVWSIDDLGALDPTPAEREFICNPEFAGAPLCVRTNFLGNRRFRGPVWPPRYDVPIDIFEGEELVFDWYVEDEGYSSCPVLGFSYAFDDTSTWCESFSMDDTHFEVSPGVGEHALYVAAMDASWVLTRGKFAINVVETGLDDYILVVDDYDVWETNPMWGTDADRDAFYDTLTAGYVRPRYQWDPAEHIVEGLPRPPDVAALANASTVIWYCDYSTPTLAALFEPYMMGYTELAGYVRAGGNLILCGYEAAQSIIGEPYPITISESDTTPGRVFAREHLRVRRVLNTGSNANPDAPWSYGYCFLGAVPGGTGIPDDRIVDLSPMYIDSVGVGGYPEPGKWWPYAAPPMPNYDRCGMGRIDAFEPFDGHPIETHVMDTTINSEFEGRTCVMLSATGTDRGNVFYLGFPLYYLQTPQVKAVFDKILPMFGEDKL